MNRLSYAEQFTLTAIRSALRAPLDIIFDQFLEDRCGVVLEGGVFVEKRGRLPRQLMAPEDYRNIPPGIIIKPASTLIIGADACTPNPKTKEPGFTRSEVERVLDDACRRAEAEKPTSYWESGTGFPPVEQPAQEKPAQEKPAQAEPARPPVTLIDLTLPNPESNWVASYGPDAFMASLMVLVDNPEAASETVAAAMRAHVTRKDFDCLTASKNFTQKWRGTCRLAAEASEEVRMAWIKEFTKIQHERFRKSQGAG